MNILVQSSILKAAQDVNHPGLQGILEQADKSTRTVTGSHFKQI